jgi:hypothetical protein
MNMASASLPSGLIICVTTELTLKALATHTRGKRKERGVFMCAGDWRSEFDFGWAETRCQDLSKRRVALQGVEDRVLGTRGGWLRYLGGRRIWLRVSDTWKHSDDT